MKNGFNKIINYKTPSIIIFLYSFCIILIPYLVIWLLLGDINLLNLNWILPAGIRLGEKLINTKLVLNYNIFFVLIGILLFTVVVFIFIKFVFKKANFDLIAFCFMFNAMGWSTIISGLLPFYESAQTYIIISRFIIVIVSTLIVFFISNKLSSYFLFKYDDINRIAVDYKVEQTKLDEIKKEYSEIKQKKNEEQQKTFIEIIKEE